VKQNPGKEGAANAANATRVVIADDQGLFREGLRTLLLAHAELLVVGEAKDGEEAVRVAKSTRADVVLMDMKMPGLDGVAATRRLRATVPECRVVALTTFDDDEYVFEALRAGAVGYLLKDAPSERLVEAIRAAARGESFLQPSVASKVVAEFSRLAPRAAEQAASGPASLLSERELEVLRLLARGASNKEIAAALFVAEGTVKNHVTSILTKLKVTDRTQAALRARELGIA
jgi:DNA-binding NarL/FixJ family response regulator